MASTSTFTNRHRHRRQVEQSAWSADGTVLIRDSFLPEPPTACISFGGATSHRQHRRQRRHLGVGAANCVDVMTTALTPYTCA